MKDVAMDTIVWEGRKKNNISETEITSEEPYERKIQILGKAGSIPDLATNMGHL